jgi:predicted carbohydrate-binding protein with CBM5 and CBM33 domain
MIRRLAVVVAAAGAAAVLVPPPPASAHGATTTPVSRTAACATGGSSTGSAACRAAKSANGGAFGTFDNLRVPNVDGNDRKVVPDGKLCSGGLAAFKGLDVARDDFPSTSVTGGKTLSVKYRTTIPHEGSFRIYLTKQGYDPEKKLTWDDLPTKPLAEVKDPPIRDGAYVMSAKLPTDRTGRQILYIVWQTSSTPDTYYSCSDVVFKTAAAVVTKSPKPSPSRSASASPSPAAVDDQTPDEEVPSTEPAAAQAPDLTAVSDQSKTSLGHEIIGGALVVAVGFVLWHVIGGMLRRRRENH